MNGWGRSMLYITTIIKPECLSVKPSDLIRLDRFDRYSIFDLQSAISLDACLLGSAKPPSLPGVDAMRTLTAFVLLALLAAPSSLSAQSADFAIPAHVARVDGRALIE